MKIVLLNNSCMGNFLSIMDTDRFGFKIARVNCFDRSPKELIAELKNEGVKLVISRVNCENLELINQLEYLHFKTMDFQIVYKYDLLNLSFGGNIANPDFTIREATISDKKDLIQIAAKSFNHYGHYFRDKKLDPSKCLEIYMDWVKRSIDDKNVADVVFLAETKKKIAGFLSFKVIKGESLYSAGVQGAVAKEFRDQRVFRSLAQYGLLWGSNQKLEWVEHNVLLTNYPVNRSFISIGFIPYKSFITMHNWLD